MLLGLAFATKWSGLYYIAFFGVMSLAFDVSARRAYRVPRPWLGVLRRDLGPAVYVFGLIPLAVYLASYGPWFASETAINRYEVGQSIGPRQWYQPPDAIRSLWHYTWQGVSLPFRATNSPETTTCGNPSPDLADVAAAGAVRDRQPKRARLRNRLVCEGGHACRDTRKCGGSRCPSCSTPPGGHLCAATGATPSCWSATAGWLPWFADIDRQMYFFYAVPMAPFLIMGIALILGDIVYHPRSPERHTLGLIVASMYLALAITNFAWLCRSSPGHPYRRPPGSTRSGCPAGGGFRSRRDSPEGCDSARITATPA